MKYSYEYERMCIELYRQGKWAETVLSIVFRKNISAKMKICAGKPGWGAAKPHLVALQHIPAALSRVTHW